LHCRPGSSTQPGAACHRRLCQWRSRGPSALPRHRSCPAWAAAASAAPLAAAGRGLGHAMRSCRVQRGRQMRHHPREGCPGTAHAAHPRAQLLASGGTRVTGCQLSGLPFGKRGPAHLTSATQGRFMRSEVLPPGVARNGWLLSTYRSWRLQVGMRMVRGVCADILLTIGVQQGPAGAPIVALPGCPPARSNCAALCRPDRTSQPPSRHLKLRLSTAPCRVSMMTVSGCCCA
jgi:hypothetical protein